MAVTKASRAAGSVRDMVVPGVRDDFAPDNGRRRARQLLRIAAVGGRYASRGVTRPTLDCLARSANRVTNGFGGSLPVLDLPELILAKRAAGRPKEIAQLPELEALGRCENDSSA